MSDAQGGLPPIFIWTVLAYLLLGPPVAGIIALLALGGAEVGAGELLQALPPYLGVTSIIAGLPAVVTGLVAAFAGRLRSRWLRLVLPAAVAVVGGTAFVAMVLGGSPFRPDLLLALAAAALIGALVPGVLIELFRRERPPAPGPSPLP